MGIPKRLPHTILPFGSNLSSDLRRTPKVHNSKSSLSCSSCCKSQRHRIPFPPSIHDSIIVPENDKNIGRMCLSGAFNRVVGRTPVSEMKS